MPPLSWTGQTGRYYMRLTYGDSPVAINFVNPALLLEPSDLAVRAENYSLAGFMERLHIRDEIRIHIIWHWLFESEVEALRTFYHAWGKYGHQSVLLLDPSGVASTPNTQYEEAIYSEFFDRAELLTNPFVVKQTVAGDNTYTVDFVFRQGVDEEA